MRSSPLAASVPFLVAAVEDRTLPARLRARACRVLGGVGDLEVVPSLARLQPGVDEASLPEELLPMVTIR